MDLNLEQSLLRLNLPYAICPVSPVEPEAVNAYRQWISEGKQAGMQYLEKYDPVRANPELLLPGAKSMLIVAFPYRFEAEIQLPIALYARGKDYHDVVRDYLKSVAALIPGESRICVDSAPLRERYWAAKSGLGQIGRNNQLFVPGFGSFCFIATILTTALLPSHRPFDFPSPDPCGDCRRCIDACPGKCIPPDGSAIDARKCISYLTIEHRGPLPEGLKLRSLYGCDVCQTVCPLNRQTLPSPIPEFAPSDAIKTLTLDAIETLTQEQFSTIFRGSPIKRTKLPGLLRNAQQLVIRS